MKKILLKTICFSFIIGFTAVTPVRVDMDYEIEKLADKAQWSLMFETLHKRGFDSLSGFNRYVYVAVSHLAREDAIGYEYEKNLLIQILRMYLIGCRIRMACIYPPER